MEILKLEGGLQQAVSRARDELDADGVILYPTDTVYGLGADAFSDEAVEKIYAIKGRDPQNPISCVVADLETAAEFVEVNDVARKLAEKFLPGPLTMILKKKKEITGGIARGIDTIAIRIPRNEFCLTLARAYGRPFTTTSANLSGLPTGSTVDEILEQLGETSQLIDLSIDGGRLEDRKPSTIIDLATGLPSVLRTGVISEEEILRCYAA